VIARDYSLDALASGHAAMYGSVLALRVHSRAIVGEQALRP